MAQSLFDGKIFDGNIFDSGRPVSIALSESVSISETLEISFFHGVSTRILRTVTSNTSIVRTTTALSRLLRTVTDKTRLNRNTGGKYGSTG